MQIFELESGDGVKVIFKTYLHGVHYNDILSDKMKNFFSGIYVTFYDV